MDKLKKLLGRETVAYLIFGVLTTVVNIVSFALLCDLWHIPELVANVIAWAVSVAFAYVTNRGIVFRSEARGLRAILREIGLFVGARVLSLGLDEAGMAVCLYVLHWHKMAAKIFMNVLVVIFNYIASKLLIFRSRKEES
jgi:putative flippase GtrA